MHKHAQSSERCMEMLQMTDYVKAKLRSEDVAVRSKCDKTFARNIADLVLVSMSKNQQHVKAIAANSVKVKRDAQPEEETSHNEEDDDVEH